MADMKPVAWLTHSRNGMLRSILTTRTDDEYLCPGDVQQPLYTADDLEQARREEREACAIAAWSAGMEYHNRVLGMPADAREVGSAGAAAIRARNEKGGA